MFIRKNKSTTGEFYYHIAESYRNENGEPRQRVLMSLGKAKDETLEKLSNLLKKHFDIASAISTAKDVDVDIDVKDTFILGPLLIIEGVFKKLGLYDLLSDIKGKHPKIKFDLLKIVFTLVINRFVEPCSKLKVFSHWQDIFYPGLLKKDIKLHTIYRCLDLLAEHKDDIEKSLYFKGQAQRSLFNECDVFLYDLTTLRFESVRKDLGNLRQFGYSKEMRSDCTQVVLGLMVDKDGMPIGFDVYPGNTFEGTTVPDMISKLSQKFQVRRFILVGDRGLFSKGNLDYIHKQNKEFIVGLKLGLLKDRQDEIYNKKNFYYINRDKSLGIYETSYNGHRCLVTWSKKRAERDKRVRDDILSKIDKKLSKKALSSRDFVSNSNYKKYIHYPQEKGQPELNKDVISKEEERDGFFGLITNVRGLTAGQIIENYKQLWKVEDAFRELKGTLKTRPVFHWTDQRIKGHLVLCFLAYLCEAYISKQLKKKGVSLSNKATKAHLIPQRALTVSEAMMALKEVRAIPLSFKGKILWIRTDITGHATEVFKALGVRIPSKHLKMR